MVPPARRIGWRCRAEYVRVPDGLALDPHDGPDALQLEATLEDARRDGPARRRPGSRSEISRINPDPGMRMGCKDSQTRFSCGLEPFAPIEFKAPNQTEQARIGPKPKERCGGRVCACSGSHQGSVRLVPKRRSSSPASSTRNLDDVGTGERPSKQLVPVGRSIDRKEFGQRRATPNATRTRGIAESIPRAAGI